VNGLHFAEPGWIHALWAVFAVVALLTALERRGTGALERLVSPTLQERLVRRPSPWRRWLRIGLLGMAGVALVLSLMRPQLGLRHVATPRVGAEIMIALDVSRSMLAEDVAPNRLERAKAEIADLLPYLDGDAVGLIAFAGRASVLSPLTPDFGFLRLVLEGVGQSTGWRWRASGRRAAPRAQCCSSPTARTTTPSRSTPPRPPPSRVCASSPSASATRRAARCTSATRAAARAPCFATRTAAPW
jgi:hypothetical protein